MSRASAGPGWAYRLYLGLALAGAVIPYAILLPWIGRYGFDLPRFLAGPFANGPASIFSADVLLSAAVFLVFASIEGRRLGLRLLWLPPLIVLTIGLCCALPVFLAQRERALANAA